MVDESSGSVQQLLDDLQRISEEASLLQSDEVDDAAIDRVRDEYLEWFARAIRIVPEDAKARFRDALEGGQFTSRIRAYLSNPKKPSPFYNPKLADNPLAGQPYQYDFDRTFRLNADAQRQILIESSYAASVRDGTVRADSEGDVFIVHGHDDGTLHAVVRLVWQITNSQPTVLRELPNQGKTIIEKIEAHAARCSFAIVLLTPDDVGRSVNAESDTPRARQNVVFEAGYFVGLLGRQRVALLYRPGVELPSDLNGIAYISIDGGWQLDVAKELRAAGIEVDLNRL